MTDTTKSGPQPTRFCKFCGVREDATKPHARCADKRSWSEVHTFIVRTADERAEFEKAREDAELPHVLALFEAWNALKRLGWQEPRYFHFPAEGQEFEMIELGSTGIHRAVVRGLDPPKTCWVDYEWPSQPFLVRKLAPTLLEEFNGRWR